MTDLVPVDDLASVAFLQLGRLSEDETRILGELRAKLSKKERRNKLRSNYYDGKHRLEKMGISIPPQMQDIETVVGWPAKAVDVLEQRLDMEGFVLPDNTGLTDELNAIYDDNSMESESSQAHVSALTHGTAFAFVTRGDENRGDPSVVISIRSARQATAIYNRRRRRLDSALEIIAEEGTNSDRYVILHLPDQVITLRRDGREWVVESRVDNPTGWVLCQPFVHRPFIERVFGMSRISRPVMSLTDTAVRTILRTEVSAEFYSAPQRYLLGADESAFQDKDGNVKTGWETIIGHVWGIRHPEPDEDGVEKPPLQVGQFPQQSMVPHTEHLRSTATMFSGETAIPVSYLGIIHDNPASADAIRAGEAELVKVAERDHVTLGAGHAGIGRLAIMVREGLSQPPEALRRLRVKWRDASTPTKQAQAQSVMSLVSVGVYLPRSDVTREQLGLDQTTIERMQAEDRRADANDALERLAALRQPQQQPPGGRQLEPGQAAPRGLPQGNGQQG